MNEVLIAPSPVMAPSPVIAPSPVMAIGPAAIPPPNVAGNAISPTTGDAARRGKVFLAYDKNRDGQVTLNEWFAMKEGMRDSDSERRALETRRFREADPNSDGKMTRSRILVLVYQGQVPKYPAKVTPAGPEMAIFAGPVKEIFAGPVKEIPRRGFAIVTRARARVIVRRWPPRMIRGRLDAGYDLRPSIRSNESAV